MYCKNTTNGQNQGIFLQLLKKILVLCPKVIAELPSGRNELHCLWFHCSKLHCRDIPSPGINVSLSVFSTNTAYYPKFWCFHNSYAFIFAHLSSLLKNQNESISLSIYASKRARGIIHFFRRFAGFLKMAVDFYKS